MPQPYPSRHPFSPERSFSQRWAANAGWPVDVAAPERLSPIRNGESGEKRKAPNQKAPSEDARTPDDKDGNEQLRRQKQGEVEKHLPNSDVPSQEAAGNVRAARRDMETEDTGEWVASQPFSLEDELEDTWPNLPPAYLGE